MLLLTLFLLAAPPAHQALLQAETVALCRLEGPPTVVAHEEGKVWAVRLELVAGALPDRIHLVLPPGTKGEPNGLWLLAGQVEGDIFRAPIALVVPPATQRATARFARAYRETAHLAPEEAVDHWIAFALDPSPIARQIGAEALVAHADAIRGLIQGPRLERLAGPIFEPGVTENRRAETLRQLRAVSNEAMADVLARRLEQIPSPRVTLQAIGLMAKFPTPIVRRALRTCADGPRRDLAMRCQRTLARLPPAPPTAP